MRQTLHFFLLFLFLTIVQNSYAQWANFPNANAVYGQTDFTSITNGNGTTNFFIRPVSVAFTKNDKKLIVANVHSVTGQNSKLYFYNDYSLNTGTNLAFKLDLPSSGGGQATANSIFVDEDDNLWVITNGATNNSLYKYTNASSLTAASSPVATINLKKYDPSFTVPVGRGFKGSIYVKSGKLFLADASAHVVARYSVSSLEANGTVSAEALLGLPTIPGALAGDSIRFNTPVQLTVDNNNALWVADQSNLRVLKFDNAFTFTATSLPSLVLGKSNYTASATRNNTKNDLYSLRGIASDPSGRIYVGLTDETSSKVFIYDTRNIVGPLNNTTVEPVNVIGHDVINSTYAPINSNAPTANKFYNVSNIAVHGDALWVTDYAWHRVLRFDALSSLPVTLTDFKVSQVNNDINVSWATSAEERNSHFIVSTSTDGKNFEQRATISAKNEASTYTTSFPISTVLTAGFGLLGLLAVPRLKNKFLSFLTLAVYIAMLASCVKEEITEKTVGKTIYVKLEQVDLDGTITELGIYSLKIK